MARYRVIDTTTNTVIEETDSLHPELMTGKGYIFPSRKGLRCLHPLPEGIDASRVVNLAWAMNGDNSMPGTLEDMAKLMGLSKDRGIRLISKLLSSGVLKRARINSRWRYYINPAYYIKAGHRLSLELFLMFRDELSPLLPQWVVTQFLAQTKPVVLQEVEEILASTFETYVNNTARTLKGQTASRQPVPETREYDDSRELKVRMVEAGGYLLQVDARTGEILYRMAIPNA